MKIVVRGTNWIGDAVMTIPALRELRRIFPDAEITLHTRSWATGIFQDTDFVDEILPFEPQNSKIRSTICQAKLWRQKKFDLAILFTNSFETALLAKLSNVPGRFGYAKEGRSILLTESFKIPEWKNDRHEIFYYLNLISEIESSLLGTKSVSQSQPKFDLNVSDLRQTFAKELLLKNGADLSKLTVAFVAGSTNSRAKRWGTESYAALNDKIQLDLEANVILIGASQEMDVAKQIARQSRQKPITLAGKTDIAEVTAILSLCDLVVSNDTGPAHIAAALGVKTLVIFGPTNPKTTQPWNSEIIREDNIECSPCMLRDCPIDHRCMTRISPDRVFEKLCSML
jgi:heptosyltransferase II